MNHRSIDAQRGLTVMGLIFMLVVVGMFGILGLKIVPTFVEYRAVVKAITTAKASGTTVREIQESFNKTRAGGYIESITSSDLEITKSGNEIEISFAYQKKIPLVGFASLVLDYTGTTANSLATKKPPE